MDVTTIITQIFLPISLAIIMFGMGLTLVINDFTRLFTYPKEIFIGLFNQLVFLPLIGFLIILSVTLTALASLITVFTIPIILSEAIAYFSGETDVIIELPIVQTMIQILVITVIPVSIGMVIRKKNEDFALRMERPMRIASTVLFIIIFLLVMIANKDLIVQAMKEVGLATLLLNLSTMALGYMTAKLFGVKGKSQISITIESGIQNGTLAFVIATTILNNVEMGLPTGAYSIWMFISGGILMWRLGGSK